MYCLIQRVVLINFTSVSAVRKKLLLNSLLDYFDIKAFWRNLKGFFVINFLELPQFKQFFDSQNGVYLG
jgi:hypothetical protein